MTWNVHNGTDWDARTPSLWDGAQWFGAGGSTPAPTPTDVRSLIESQLDPANYPGRVFTVGTDAPTISETLALADAASSSTAWSLVVIPPGTYAERVVRPHQTGWTDVRSSTLNPADVILDPPNDTDDTWEHYGTGGIIAGITLKGKGTKSAVHCGEFGATYDFIYYKVVGTQTGTGNDAFSWGIGPNQHVYAYDCEWNGLPGVRAVYTHNFPAPQPAAGTILFDGCKLTGPTDPAASIWSILEENSGQPDKVYVIGGSSTGTISAGYLNGDSTIGSSFTGNIDPVHDVFIRAGINIAHTLPAEAPTPARLADT